MNAAIRLCIQAAGFSAYFVAGALSLQLMPDVISSQADQNIDLHILVMNAISALALIAIAWRSVPRNIRIVAPILAATTFLLRFYLEPTGSANEQWGLVLLLVFCVANYLANTVQFGVLVDVVRSGRIEVTILFFTAGVIFACAFTALLETVPNQVAASLAGLAYLGPLVSLIPANGIRAEQDSAESPSSQNPLARKHSMGLWTLVLSFGAGTDIAFWLNDGSIFSNSMGSLPTLLFIAGSSIHFMLLVFLAKAVSQNPLLVFFKNSVVLNTLLVVLFIWAPTLSEESRSLWLTAAYFLQIATGGISAALFTLEAKKTRERPTPYSIMESWALTKREMEVAQLLVEGWSAPDIQEKLVISRGTVWTHIGHIYEKAGVSSRSEFMKKVHGDRS